MKKNRIVFLATVVIGMVFFINLGYSVPIMGNITYANNSFIYPKSTNNFTVDISDANLNTSNVTFVHTRALAGWLGGDLWELRTTCSSLNPYRCHNDTDVRTNTFASGTIWWYFFEATNTTSGYSSIGNKTNPYVVTTDQYSPNFQNNTKTSYALPSSGNVSFNVTLRDKISQEGVANVVAPYRYGVSTALFEWNSTNYTITTAENKTGTGNWTEYYTVNQTPMVLNKNYSYRWYFNDTTIDTPSDDGNWNSTSSRIIGVSDPPILDNFTYPNESYIYDPVADSNFTIEIDSVNLNTSNVTLKWRFGSSGNPPQWTSGYKMVCSASNPYFCFNITDLSGFISGQHISYYFEVTDNYGNYNSSGTSTSPHISYVDNLDPIYENMTTNSSVPAYSTNVSFNVTLTDGFGVSGYGYPQKYGISTVLFEWNNTNYTVTTAENKTSTGNWTEYYTTNRTQLTVNQLFNETYYPYRWYFNDTTLNTPSSDGNWNRTSSYNMKVENPYDFPVNETSVNATYHTDGKQWINATKSPINRIYYNRIMTVNNTVDVNYTNVAWNITEILSGIKWYDNQTLDGTIDTNYTVPVNITSHYSVESITASESNVTCSGCFEKQTTVTCTGDSCPYRNNSFINVSVDSSYPAYRLFQWNSTSSEWDCLYGNSSVPQYTCEIEGYETTNQTSLNFTYNQTDSLAQWYIPSFSTHLYDVQSYGAGSPTAVCGNGACEAGESTSSCPSDCGSPSGGGGGGVVVQTVNLTQLLAICGDGTCQETESFATCSQDCPLTGGYGFAKYLTYALIGLVGYVLIRGNKKRTIKNI